ncbi:MAG: NAD(P)-binding protein [Myxococcota bacterium]
MSLQRFDTLILGDDISGLVAANLLTHFHYKVVVLRNSTPADRYIYDGYTLPISPSVIPPLHYGELMSQIRQFFTLSQSEFDSEADIVEKFQFITKRLRLDISINQDETIEEFLCELGIKRENISRFIDVARKAKERYIDAFNLHYPYPPYTFWDKRRIQKNIFAELNSNQSILNLLDSEKGRAAFRTVLTFIQNLNTKNILFSQDSLLGFIFSERWIILPSIERIKSTLIRRLEDKGVLILNNTPNRYRVEKRGFNYYIRDERQHNSYRIESILLAADRDFIASILEKKIFSRLNIKSFPYLIRYTTNFVVGIRCIPEMASNLIYYKEDVVNSDVSQNYQISFTKAMRGRAIIKENRIISVTTYIKPEEFNKKNVDILNQRAKDILLRVFPFSDEYIVNISSVLNAEILLDVNLNEIRRLDYKPSQYIFITDEVQDGIMLFDMKTGIDNFINSAYVFAPIGIFGDFMSAVRASEIISKNILGK